MNRFRTSSRLMLLTARVIAALTLPAVNVTTAEAAAAQSAPGFISGLVRDASGAPIPGATVAVVNERTGTSAPAVSNEEGIYRSAALAPARIAWKRRSTGSKRPCSR